MKTDKLQESSESAPPSNSSAVRHPPISPSSIYPLLLLAAMVGYLVLSCHATFYRHDHLVTSVFDLGIFDQAVWLMSRGHPLFLTTRGLNVFADHFDPILYFLAPLYWIWASPKVLLFVQCVACAIGAHPIYRIAEKRLGHPAYGLLFAILYLFYPALQWINNFDFHPEALAIPSLLYAFWFLESKRTTPYFCMLFMVLLCKETAGLTILILGIIIFLKRDRRLGLFTAIAGIAGFLIAMISLRIANFGQTSAYISLYSDFGNSPSSIALYLLTHPFDLLTHLTAPDNMQYWVALLFPLLCLPLLSPEYLAIAMPALLANMLSNRDSMHGIYYQYNALVIPPIFMAGVKGFEVCLEYYSRMNAASRIFPRIAVTFFFVIALVSSWAGGPFTSGMGWDGGVNKESLAQIKQGLALIPPNASVCAQTAIAAHMTDRTNIYMLPNPFQQSCWGNSKQALDNQLGRNFKPLSEKALRRAIQASQVDYIVLGPWNSSDFPLSWQDNHYFTRIILTDPHYGVIWADRIIVLKRGANYRTGLRILKALWGSLWTEIKLSREKQDRNPEIDEPSKAFGV